MEEGIFSIKDCQIVQRGDFEGSVPVWNDSELDVLLLDDDSWAARVARNWAADFIRLILPIQYEKETFRTHLLALFKNNRIECEQELLQRWKTIQWPAMAKRAITEWAGKQGHSDGSTLNETGDSEAVQMALPAAERRMGPGTSAATAVAPGQPSENQCTITATATNVFDFDTESPRPLRPAHQGLAFCLEQARKLCHGADEGGERGGSVRSDASEVSNLVACEQILEAECRRNDYGVAPAHSRAEQCVITKNSNCRVSSDSSLLLAFQGHARLNRKLDRTNEQYYTGAHIRAIDAAINRSCESKKRLEDGSSVVLGHWSSYKVIGCGGFGIVVQVTWNPRNSPNETTHVIKFEFTPRTSPLDDSTVLREHNLYSSISASKDRPGCPLPQLSGLLGRGHSFATLHLSQIASVHLLCMECLGNRPQEIIAESRKLFSQERRACSEGRHLVLAVLGAILYLDERGISHNDLKVEHLFYRANGSLVIIDFGLAQRTDYRYIRRDRSQLRVVRGPAMAHDFSYAAALSSTDNLRILGEPDRRPGTPGYRPHCSIDNAQHRSKVNVFQLGMILFRIICPRAAEDEHSNGEAGADRLEALVYRIASMKFEDFLREVLSYNPSSASNSSRRAQRALGAVTTGPTVHEYFGQGIARLCHGFLHGNFKFLVSSRDAFRSDFVRTYIPASMTWFDLVRTRGVLVSPKHGVKNPCVLVWAKARGFAALPLFTFCQGEHVGNYIGFVQVRSNGGYLSAESFSLHSIAWSATHVLDGTPSFKLPAETMAEECAVGPLYQSSRTKPDKRANLTANVTSPNKPAASITRQITLQSGDQAELVFMYGSRHSYYGDPFKWDYNWDAQGSGVQQAAFAGQQRLDAIEHHISLPSEWKDIVRVRRQEMMMRGFKDSVPENACSISNCSCTGCSPADIFLFDQKTDVLKCEEAFGGLGEAKTKDKYWEMPGDILPEQLHKITVRTDYYEQDDTLDSSKREQRRREAGEALAQYGVAVLTEFVSSVPSGGGLLDAAAYALGGLAFTESVVQNVPRAGKVPDFGDESKLMCPPIHEDTHPVAMALKAVADEYLPGFVVARGKDYQGTACTERVVLRQDKGAHHDYLCHSG